MPEPGRIDPTEARRLCAGNYAPGLEYFRKGAVRDPWRGEMALHAAVAGSANEPYTVTLTPRDDGAWEAKCTCPAARRQSVCKHAAAVFIAWAERPSAFAVHAEPAPGPVAPPKLETEAKRARQPKVDRRLLVAEGLDRAEALLVDLGSRGLVAVTAEQVSTIGAVAEAVEAHKLRRLARQVVELQRAAQAVQSGAGAGGREWARLLGEAWFVLQATRRALDKGDAADQAELEELIGKTWLEKDLRQAANLRLVELAYQTAVLSSGFRVETSYLLDLGDGTLYTEKQITPVRLKLTQAPRKRSYATPLRVARAGVYPGFPPLRLKLAELAEEPHPGGAWDRAIALAETSATALRQRLIQSTASLVAPQEAYALYHPAAVVASADALHLADAAGKAVLVAPEPRAALYGLRGALARGPLGTVFCRLRFAADALVADPLSVVLGEDGSEGRLVRLTG